jgi:hypothetical protein
MLTRARTRALRQSARCPEADGDVDIAHNKGFPYYGKMNVTLSLNDELVKKVRKLAVERDTTLTAMIREYLEKVAAADGATGRKRREREALERTFERYKVKIGKRTWKRSDLYERS